MSVKGKSIRSINRVLNAAKGKDKVRFVFDVTGESSEVWEALGFPSELEQGAYLIPSALGPATDFNAQGKDVPQKHLPKETVTHMVWHTWTDWHGYEHSDYLARDYKRYPREHVPAPSEYLYGFFVEGLKFIATREISLKDDDEATVVHLANVMLECFGEFQVADPDPGIPTGIAYKRLQWRILPKGSYPWDRAKPLVREYSSLLDESSQKVVERRAEYIAKYEPEFIATGQGGFHGYFVYGFEAKQLYILESLHLGNATYVFGNDWEALSKLTKSEIINGDLAIDRIIHDSNWYYNIRKTLG
jgi:hypothetical protein